MSWDLFVQDWGGFSSLNEIPDDFIPSTIGYRIEIIEKIKKAEPTVDFTDLSWGLIDNEHFSIEFNMGDEAIIHSFCMHVRGNKLAIPCIGNILNVLELRAADGASPNFFDIEKSKLHIKKWIEYRNKIISK